MAEQEIDFITVIAADDFRAAGKHIKKSQTFRATKNTAKQLVATGQARYPAEGELEALAEDDTAPEPSKDTAPEPSKDPEPAPEKPAASRTKASK